MSAFKVGAGLMFLGISALAPITEQRPPAGGGATVKGVAAATAFLDTLDPSRRAKATLPLNKTTRTVWSNLPTGVTMQVVLRSEEHTSELQSLAYLVCRLLLEKKNTMHD